MWKPKCLRFSGDTDSEPKRFQFDGGTLTKLSQSNEHAKVTIVYYNSDPYGQNGHLGNFSNGQRLYRPGHTGYQENEQNKAQQKVNALINVLSFAVKETQLSNKYQYFTLSIV